MNNPIVSVWMVTYNHEKYIEQAVESVMMQDTNFEYHLFIGEDNSLDSTGAKCKKLAKKYPKKLTLVTNKKNLGPYGNAIQIYDLCFKSGSKYMALLEGDDYWTDPLKLQTQVNFLEENLDYNICFHKVKIYNELTKKLEHDNITRFVDSTTTVTELACGNYIHTPTVLIRNNFRLPKWFAVVPVGDWTLYMIAVKNKKIKKIDKFMSVYRQHNSGVWSGKNRQQKLKMTIKTFELVYENVTLNDEAKVILKNEIDNFRQKYKKRKKSRIFYLKVVSKIKFYLNKLNV